MNGQSLSQGQEGTTRRSLRTAKPNAHLAAVYSLGEPAAARAASQPEHVLLASLLTPPPSPIKRKARNNGPAPVGQRRAAPPPSLPPATPEPSVVDDDVSVRFVVLRELLRGATSSRARC